jgi:6-phosphofructokinase 1
MLPTMAGAANRCVIPEYKFDMEHLTELLCYDRRITRANIQSLSFQKGQCSKAVRWCSPTGRPTRSVI